MTNLKLGQTKCKGLASWATGFSPQRTSRTKALSVGRQVEFSLFTDPSTTFSSSATCPFSLDPNFTPLPLEDPPEEGKVGQIQFGPYTGAQISNVHTWISNVPFFYRDISDFLGTPLSTFLPVEWGGRAFAYCAENGFSLLTPKSTSFI